MKKTKIFAAFTAFILAVSFLGCDLIAAKAEEETEEKSRSNQKVVKFGSYPQSKMAEGVTITGGPVTENGWECYTGSDGEKYVNYNSSYYKIEPIKWKKITSDYEGTDKALYFSEIILDYEDYWDESNYPVDNNRKIDKKTIYPANYEHSRLRAYLNGLSYYSSKSLTSSTEFEGKGFLQKAFNDEERAEIAVTPVKVSSYAKGSSDKVADKVFVLSKDEVTNTKYHFGASDTNGDESNRVRKISDYATARYQVAFNSSDVAFHDYWLRTPKDNDEMWIVWPGGTLFNNLTSSTNGICPAICK